VRPGRSRSARLALVCAAALAVSTPAVAHASGGGTPFTFAVLGDTPYGNADVLRFPGIVDQVNADPDVRLVAHLGDIKSGSTVCDDAYYAAIRAQFDRFEDPLVYTPGDNEWTDCHRPNNGGYDPLERLDALRSVFFDRPGHALGTPRGLSSQRKRGLPENVSFTRAGVAFAAVHVVGSNDGLAPWTGRTAPTAAQLAEQRRRSAGAVQLIDRTFARAEGKRAVVLMMQADMFEGTPSEANGSAFRPVVQAIAEGAAGFDGPVYLLNGDTHVFERDNPLEAGSPWLSFYGLAAPVPNLTRITVEGAAGVDEYLRVTVDVHDPEVLVFERVPLA
jgi:hypothetical protein